MKVSDPFWYNLLLHIITFAGGALLSLLFMALLWRSVNKLAAGGHGGVRLLPGMLLRLLLVSGVLFLTFKFLGPWHLVSALAGFVLTRTVVIKRWAVSVPAGDRETGRMGETG